MNDTNPLKALVCPLDWGWGHATRTIPVIHLLQRSGFEVIIGTSGASGEFLKNELPGYSFFNLPSFSIHYSSDENQVFAIFKQIPKILRVVYNEHKIIKKIVERENIDLVVSDQRYGLWTKSAYSVFMTHQLNVIFPKSLKILSYIFNFLQHKFIQQFDECWVPDDKQNLNLSGKLSDVPASLKQVFYAGIFSRFGIPENVNQTSNYKHDLLVLLSGPEKQRTLLENILLSQLQNKNYNVLFVRGTLTPRKQTNTGNNVAMVDYLNSTELYNAILESGLIICRPGYSTVMDLVRLKKQALFIPTPGQTEQEYIAEHLMARKYFFSVSQKELLLERDIKLAMDYNIPEHKDEDSALLKRRIKIIHNKLYQNKSDNNNNHS
ncbi:MAG: glycosyltransferase [Bacteroidales bacterium]